MIKKIFKKYENMRPSELGVNIDMLIALAPLIVISVVFYGMRPAFMCLCALISCIAVSLALKFIFKFEWPFVISAAAAGITAVLLCPASLPIWAVVAAPVLGVTISAVFYLPVLKAFRIALNPAAVTLSGLLVMLSGKMLLFPMNSAESRLPAYGLKNFTTETPLSDMVRDGFIFDISFYEGLFGRFAGPMGATCILLVALAALYLIYRHSVSLSAMLTFVVIYSGGTFYRFFEPFFTVKSTVLHLFSGGILFMAVFMVGNFFGAPGTVIGRIIYGGFIAAVAVALDVFGYNMTLPFVIVAANFISKLIDFIIKPTAKHEERAEPSEKPEESA